MKPLSFSLALFATLSAFSAGVRAANSEPCAGPFAQCAWAVGGWCERDRGGQVIHYWNYPGNVMVFERCVGGIFEAAGNPDPFKTGVATVGSRRKGGAALSLPRSELHYPNEPN